MRYGPNGARRRKLSGVADDRVEIEWRSSREWRWGGGLRIADKGSRNAKVGVGAGAGAGAGEEWEWEWEEGA